MPNPLLPVVGATVGVSTGTMISESALMTPKEICLFYGGIDLIIKNITIFEWG